MEPAPVLQIAHAYAGLPEAQSPMRTLARQARERKRLTKAIQRKMPLPRRAAFRWMLREAQRGVMLREEMKSVIVRAMRLTDYLLPEVATRLVAQGTIATADDIFFLAQSELRDALTSPSAPDFRTAVARRRREFERNRYVVLPERFRGRPSPIAPETPAEGTTRLTGTPVSPGIVTAKARVIRDPRTDPAIQPGEILVAPVTDAGWTPLFALASGLVVDMGSALSHGSTVAREYGLPAVVNVRGATRLIRTGDLVTIDGAKGTVTVVPSEDALAG
jgi:pyruvate,water dikinase